MDARIEDSRGGASNPSSISSTLLGADSRPAARGLAATGRSLRAGGLSLVSPTGGEQRRRGRRGPRGVRRRVRPSRSVPPRPARTTVLGPGCGRSPATRSATIFASGAASPMPKAARTPTSNCSTWPNRPRNPLSGSRAQRVETDAGFLRRMLDLVRVEFENRTWEAFWRIVVDGQSPAEVAAAMDLSLPAVYKAKSRVLRRLREQLQGLLE